MRELIEPDEDLAYVRLERDRAQAKVEELRTELEKHQAAMERVAQVLLVPASNLNMMGIAAPARQCLNILKPFIKV